MQNDRDMFPTVGEIYKGDIIDTDAMSPRTLREVTQHADRKGKQVMKKRIDMQAVAADAANLMETHISVAKAADEAAMKHPEEERVFNMIKAAAFKINLDIFME